MLCDTEVYAARCWKEECDNCCHEKAINSYKKCSCNDQKRLTLKASECSLGEIKEKIFEQFEQHKNSGFAFMMKVVGEIKFEPGKE